MEELWLTIVTRVLLEGMDSGLEQVKSCYKFRENASSMRRLRRKEAIMDLPRPAKLSHWRVSQQNIIMMIEMFPVL